MYSRIVVGTDGSAAAHDAVRHAHALAAGTGGHLYVATAYSTGGDGSACQRAEELLQHAVMRLPPLRGGVVTCCARPGPVADVLLELVRETTADLLVVGAARRGARGAPSPVAAALVRQAGCPLVVVHDGPAWGRGGAALDGLPAEAAAAFAAPRSR